MLNEGQWRALPDLVRRRDLLAVGLNDELLRAVTVVVESAAEIPKLKPRTIAAIRPQRTDGKRAKLYYFKATVEPFRGRGA
jgi:hypothetical protein